MKEEKMVKKIIICFLLLVFLVANGNTEQTRPVCVSPGSESGTVVVGQSCPTFSWSAVQWTEAYRVVVFQAFGEEVLSYEEMEILTNPVLSKEIRGPALSWTPSEEERLSNGGIYVWYVQAVDASGIGVWSEGRMFQVEVAVRLVGVEEKLRESLREYGMSDEDIDRVLNDVTAGMREVDVQGGGMMPPGAIGIQGNETGSNTWYGEEAANSINTALAIGNSLFGYRAGYTLTDADFNTFIGSGAGYQNTSGDRNTFIGYSAGYENTSGDCNTFIGYVAGYYNTAGAYNNFLGYYAGYQNTGSSNTFLGNYAGRYNYGSSNAFLGDYAGSNNTGDYNAFFGYRAGYYNEGERNLFFGMYAGYGNTTGERNTCIGSYAGYLNETGVRNLYLGSAAGYANTTGSANTYLGYYAGRYSTGSGNVFIGYRAGHDALTGSNMLFIENSDSKTPLIFGRFDTDIVAIYGKLGIGKNPATYPIEVTGGAWCDGAVWHDASSREYKENIERLEAGEAMEALEGLEPVKFTYKRNKGEEYVGFIAEDVPELVATRERKGMSAMDVVAVLTKVVQEQQKKDEVFKQMIQEQQKTIGELQRQIEELKKRND